MIRFATPGLLPALIVVPAAIAWYWRAQKMSRRCVRLSDLSALRGIAPSWAARARHLTFALRMTALAMLLLAFARPQAGASHEEVLTRGIDIAIALDNSTSMAAEDFQPHNRLAVAKKAVAQFVEGRKNDRIGLVIFAGRGYTRCPLTLDYDILLKLLAQVEMATQDEGTAVGMGMVTALNRLRDSDAKSRVMIVITDGRNNRGEIDPSTAASLARTLGIKVYTIGVGTKGEAPYPIQDPFFGKRYFYLKADIDDDALTAIAQETGGRYFRATDTESLNQVFEEIDAMETTDIKVRHYTRWSELFPWLLAPGLAILALESGLAGTRLRRLP